MPPLRPAAALLLLAPAACNVPVPEPIYSRCHALASSDWKARIEIVPSHHNKPIMQRMIVVTGKVTVPSGGFALAIDRGPLARLDPPVQQVILRTEPPAGGATQALVTREVSGMVPAPKRLGGVAIRCGDGILAEIDEVPGPSR